MFLCHWLKLLVVFSDFCCKASNVNSDKHFKEKLNKIPVINGVKEKLIPFVQLVWQFLQNSVDLLAQSAVNS